MDCAIDHAGTWYIELTELYRLVSYLTPLVHPINNYSHPKLLSYLFYNRPYTHKTKSLNPSGTITKGPTPKMNIPTDRSWWAASIEHTKALCFTKGFWDICQKSNILAWNSNQCLTKSGSRYGLGHRLWWYMVDRESQALSIGTLLDPKGPTCQKLQPSNLSLFWPSENTMFFCQMVL